MIDRIAIAGYRSIRSLIVRLGDLNLVTGPNGSGSSIARWRTRSPDRVYAGASGLQLTLQQPGMLRELTAAELSDGTLRFLLLVAALLTPRPPELMVLNEPENSLHHELIPALGRLIRQASKQSQVIVVSHNSRLVEELESEDDCVSIRLRKQLGETIIENASLLDRYGWKWPTR